MTITVQIALGSRNGNTDFRVDLHGDALVAAVLPGDRWRRAHETSKFQILLGAKFLGVAIQNEVYGLFTHFFDLEGKEEFNRLSELEKWTKSIFPDLASSHHPADSAIFTSGPQMWDIKHIHALLTDNRISGLPVELNECFRLRQAGRFMRGANRRAARVPSEYENKAKKNR